MILGIACEGIVEYFLGKLRTIPVALAGALPGEPDLADLPATKSRTGFGIHDAHVDPVQGSAAAHEAELVAVHNLSVLEPHGTFLKISLVHRHHSPPKVGCRKGVFSEPVGDYMSLRPQSVAREPLKEAAVGIGAD